MTDTITPASLRAHADWIDATFETGSVEARSLRNCAARLEAESARDEEAERLAEVYRVAFKAAAGDSYIADGSWAVAGIRAVLDRLAADGRLLPEGGTEDAAQTCEEMCEDNHAGLVCTRLAGHPGRHVAHNEEDQPLHAWPATPLAEAVPDGRPDGTPEKPWPTWQDAPEGVTVLSQKSYQRFVKRGDEVLEVIKYADWELDLLAPFVRVDGDKA